MGAAENIGTGARTFGNRLQAINHSDNVLQGMPIGLATQGNNRRALVHIKLIHCKVALFLFTHLHRMQQYQLWRLS